MDGLDIHVAVGVPANVLSLSHTVTPTKWYAGDEYLEKKDSSAGALNWLINIESGKFWMVGHTGKAYPHYLTVAVFSGPDILRVMKEAYKDSLEVDIKETEPYKRLIGKGYTLATEAELPTEL